MAFDINEYKKRMATHVETVAPDAANQARKKTQTERTEKEYKFFLWFRYAFSVLNWVLYLPFLYELLNSKDNILMVVILFIFLTTIEVSLQWLSQLWYSSLFSEDTAKKHLRNMLYITCFLSIGMSGFSGINGILKSIDNTDKIYNTYTENNKNDRGDYLKIIENNNAVISNNTDKIQSNNDNIKALSGIALMPEGKKQISEFQQSNKELHRQNKELLNQNSKYQDLMSNSETTNKEYLSENKDYTGNMQVIGVIILAIISIISVLGINISNKFVYRHKKIMEDERKKGLLNNYINEELNEQLNDFVTPKAENKTAKTSESRNLVNNLGFYKHSLTSPELLDFEPSINNEKDKKKR